MFFTEIWPASLNQAFSEILDPLTHMFCLQFIANWIEANNDVYNHYSKIIILRMFLKQGVSLFNYIFIMWNFSNQFSLVFRAEVAFKKMLYHFHYILNCGELIF